MSELVIVVLTLGILIIVIFLFSLLKRYKRCPSDRILVVYGKVGSSGDGEVRSAKCIHGGAAFVLPIIQDYEFLDLTPIPLEVDLRNALSKQNIRVNVPSRFMVGISTEPSIMGNAAERLLGLSLDDIKQLATDIIFGQLRVVIATMDIEEINSDREKFLINVSESVENELKKIGLKLINVNVTDITDEAGYIAALGKEATAHAVNDAKKQVAEKNRDGAIGEAKAQTDQRVKVAALMAEAKVGEAQAKQNERSQTSTANALAVEGENLALITIANSDSGKQIGEAEAKKKQRIELSRANSEAVEGENLANITIANSEANRRKLESEAKKIAFTAEKTNEAKALEESYVAEKGAELSRAEKYKASQFADIIVPAEVEKQKATIDAEAEAEQIRRIAQGEADAKYAKMQAEAKGLFEIMNSQAEGLKQIVHAAGGDAEKAVTLMIADKLPELVQTQVEAIKNIKIDKITVWDNLGNGKDGGNSTSKFLSGMLGSLPPMNDMLKMAGMELPGILQGKGENSNNENLKETNEQETDNSIEE